MRQKRRYVLAYYNGNDAINVIRKKYVEKFGSDDLARASLKMISHEDGFLIVRCSLICYNRLLETLSLFNGMVVTLNTSGTLKALGSRMDKIKRSFREGKRY